MNMSASASSNEPMEDVRERETLRNGDDDDNDGDEMFLGSEDLPRPGFLGGDVFAIEKFIVVPLAAIDREFDLDSKLSTDPQLSAAEKRQRKEALKEALGADPTFARRALSMKYDCSFNDYVADGGKRFMDPFDVTQEKGFELCIGGKDRALTLDNAKEYVDLCKRYMLRDGIRDQVDAFRAGVDDFFPASALSLLTLLTPQELRKDICGADSVANWDEEKIRSLFKLDGGKGAVEAMVAVAAIGGEGGASLSRRFSSESPTFGFLVRALKEATVVRRRQFLSFVTSLPIVTGGVIEVTPIVNSTGEFLAFSAGHLPRANTCSRKLYLPRFDDYAQFNEVFVKIVECESHFKGFFEWQGQ